MKNCLLWEVPDVIYAIHKLNADNDDVESSRVNIYSNLKKMHGRWWINAIETDKIV